MYTHYRGTTFQFAGQVQNEGKVQDLTGCTITANVYNRAGTVLIGALAVDILQPTLGVISVGYPQGTGNWPVGSARIDALFTFSDGSTLASDPDYFRILQTPVVG